MTHKLAWTAIALAVAAGCGYSGLPDAGATPCPDCLVTAVEPQLANTGQTITFESTFLIDSVTFPGDITTQPGLLGVHQYIDLVPATTAAGALTITPGTSAFPFRRASFTLGLGRFADHFEQAAGPRQDSQLTTARYGHTATVIGDHLVVIGGHGSTGPLASIEQAQINADGSLGAFAPVAGAALAEARESHASVVLGGFLYIIGGLGDHILGTVERAQINPDGSLGAFAPVATSLVTPRYGHTLSVIGNALYAIGGTAQTGVIGTFERAQINGDGSLGAFTVVDGIALQTARTSHASIVFGATLYVLGGSASKALDSVEQNYINSDDSFGPFTFHQIEELTTPRQGLTATLIGNSIYVVGGLGGTTTESAALEGLGVTGMLDPFAATGGSLRTVREGHTATVIGNYLYIIGGNSSTGGAPLATIERGQLDAPASLGAFSAAPAATVTVRRYHYTSAVIGSSYYAFGGEGGDAQSSVSRAPIAADGSLGAFEVVPGASLAIGRFDHASAVIGNFVYLIGGFGNGALTGSIERAPINPDGSLGAFAMVSGSSLVTARAGHSAIVIGGFLYVIGGLGANNTQLASIERAAINADGSLGAFTAVATSLRSARISHTSIVIGNTLVVLGGIGSGGSVLPSVELAAINADGSLAAFQAGPSLTQARYATTAAVVGGFLYVAGGLDGPEAGINTAVIGNVERAQISVTSAAGVLGSFAPVPSVSLSTPCAYHTSAVLGDRLYVVAGVANNGAFCDVQQAVLQ